MSVAKRFAAATTIALMLAAVPFASPQSQDVSPSSSSPGVVNQGGSTETAPRVESQPGVPDNSLVIRPQVTPPTPAPSTEEIPADKQYNPSQNEAALDKNFNPNNLENQRGDNRKPYLGITVKYTTECFLGKEEDGLEVVNIDPNSPAAAAGLRGPTGATALGATAATAATLLGPVSTLVNPLLAKHGALGMDGDLIVAVDDHRVRNEIDLDNEMARLRPGDTMWLTVLRPLPGGSHQTLKIQVKVGQVGETAVANAAPAEAPANPPAASSTASASSSSSGEEMVH